MEGTAGLRPTERDGAELCVVFRGQTSQKMEKVVRLGVLCASSFGALRVEQAASVLGYSLFLIFLQAFLQEKELGEHEDRRQALTGLRLRLHPLRAEGVPHAWALRKTALPCSQSRARASDQNEI